MHPALSILFFTTLAGAGQGLIVALALATLRQVPTSPAFAAGALMCAQALLLAGLLASFFHLGHKTRAWRAALMWRTSWMSREVILLPAYIGLNGLWLLAAVWQIEAPWVRALPILAIIGSILLWYCTAMIYACLRFIQEWAHPLTLVNFMLIGLSSGSIWACALASLYAEETLLTALEPLALVATLLAWVSRTASLRRNARLKPLSTLQSATGIQGQKLVQKSMGMSAGAFNTREFFHHASQQMMRYMQWFFQFTLFLVPTVLMLLSWGQGASILWVFALLSQLPGLIAERWIFFAHARHPQNLYYQTVS